MPGKRDEIVLGSLLGACQRRRNADVGERCGVSKTPGCSWIDVGARAHEFHAGGSLHHHSENIYQLLNEEMKR
ncbi:pentatricopeptide repeat-containing protein [Populus alba x Populus x berolinensis]|uniref:Pentatricopeptide repeat-containing protein n=1 Tax=Populus alba x Populus x berolinensis TaxID=444605 RepID=A0AAD6WK31_9ROSI|nr:pentatricopeptide repeat-containing protein [Populus alba x Populus x berolinensis]